MYPLCFSLVVKQKHMMYWSGRETRIIISGKAERERKKDRYTHPHPVCTGRGREGRRERRWEGKGEREANFIHFLLPTKFLLTKHSTVNLSMDYSLKFEALRIKWSPINTNASLSRYLQRNYLRETYCVVIGIYRIYYNHEFKYT